jgi:hypothetical protein
VRVALCTYWTPSYDPLVAVTSPIKQEYCDRWGYTFEQERTEKAYGNHTPWDRLEHFVRVLKQNDVAMLIDADALVTNLNKKVEDILEDRYFPSFIFTKDLNGFNDGVFLAWDCDIVERFFEEVLTEGRRLFDGHMYREQKAMEHFAHTDAYKDEVDWVPQRELQAYPAGVYNRHIPEEEWHPGDWCLHIPALPLNQRIDIATKALTQVVR